MDIHALVEEKIGKDTDFQETLAALSEEDRNSAIATKRSEMINQEFSSISDAKKKADEVATNQKIRAEKAELGLKEKGETKISPEGITPRDSLMLAKADVDLDDVDEVVDYATYKKISISDALKDTTLKTILSDRKEKRQTAIATQTKSPRSTPRDTAESLVDKAEQGQLPNDDAGIKALAEGRMARKLARLKK